MKILDLYNSWSNEEKKQALVAMLTPRKCELASDLREAGFSASDFLGAGFSASDLLGAGFSASDLREAGFSVSDFFGAGFSASDFLGAGFSASDFLRAGFSASDLLGAGFSASDFLGAGFSVSDLLGAGFSASDFLRAGFSASDFLGAGFSASDFLGAGFSASDFLEAHDTEKDIKDKTKKMGINEARFVVDTLKRGLMNGSDYGSLDSCGCLLGSAAKKAGKSVDEYCQIHNIKKDDDSPAEKWFLSVNIGDNPDNCHVAKMGVKWIQEAIAEML